MVSGMTPTEKSWPARYHRRARLGVTQNTPRSRKGGKRLARRRRYPYALRESPYTLMTVRTLFGSFRPCSSSMRAGGAERRAGDEVVVCGGTAHTNAKSLAENLRFREVLDAYHDETLQAGRTGKWQTYMRNGDAKRREGPLAERAISGK
jgi:hypothetical protein